MKDNKNILFLIKILKAVKEVSKFIKYCNYWFCAYYSLKKLKI